VVENYYVFWCADRPFRRSLLLIGANRVNLRRCAPLHDKFLWHRTFWHSHRVGCTCALGIGSAHTARKNNHQRAVLPNLQRKIMNPMNPLAAPLLGESRSVEIQASELTLESIGLSINLASVYRTSRLAARK